MADISTAGNRKEGHKVGEIEGGEDTMTGGKGNRIKRDKKKRKKEGSV